MERKVQYSKADRSVVIMPKATDDERTVMLPKVLTYAQRPRRHAART